MSKKNLLAIKPIKPDFSLLETFCSSDDTLYVFLVKNRKNVRSFIYYDTRSRSCVRFLAHDVSRSQRAKLRSEWRSLSFIAGARALSALASSLT